MSSKSDYNKTYYLKHPEIKERAKLRERQKRSKPKVNFSYPLFFLVLGTSSILLTEMAEFYGSFFRAFILEAFVLIFSVLSARNSFEKYLFHFVTLGICVLSIYGMSSKHIESGIQAYRLDQVLQKSVAELEQTIQSKESQREQLLKREWISAAKKLENQIDDLKIRLSDLRNQLVKGKPFALHSTIIQIICRVFLMLGNILLTRKLFEMSEISILCLKFQDKKGKNKSNVVSIKKASQGARKAEISETTFKGG